MDHRKSRDRLIEALRDVNRLRQKPGASPLSDTEAGIEKRYNASSHLAIYGSLAPGQPNHGVVASLKGKWVSAVVRGHLHNAGWGARGGYPGMTWDPEARPFAVIVLQSDELPSHWPRLDEFEGDDYRRILVPVDTDAGELIIANIYELRDQTSNV